MFMFFNLVRFRVPNSVAFETTTERHFQWLSVNDFH